MTNSNVEGSPATHFASPERLGPRQLTAALHQVGNSPFVNTLMELLGGWICVVSPTRQVLALNHAFLASLGIADPGHLLGLRVGELLGCVHAHDHPGGCGTSRFCATCGAAIAMVTALTEDEPQELECVLTFERDRLRQDRDFIVRCSRFTLDEETLLLVCLRDNSEEKRRSAMERVFLHDVNNILAGLLPTTELLLDEGHPVLTDVLHSIHRAAVLLSREVRIQRLLVQNNVAACRVDPEETHVGDILDELAGLLTQHCAATEQSLVISPFARDVVLTTDPGLLLRVLSNMVMNALEAGQPHDEVRIGAEATPAAVEFHVWNRAAIPARIAPRIFQRYFSTKDGPGRGLGTHIMKLLGETLLKGSVTFTSSPEAGTTFRIRVPRTLSRIDLHDLLRLSVDATAPLSSVGAARSLAGK